MLARVKTNKKKLITMAVGASRTQEGVFSVPDGDDRLIGEIITPFYLMGRLQYCIRIFTMS